MNKKRIVFGVLGFLMGFSGCRSRDFLDETASVPMGKDIANDKIIAQLKAKGIQPTYDETSFQNLVKYYDELISQKNQDLTAQQADKKTIAKELEFYNYGASLLKNPSTNREKVAAFYLGVRILYGVSTFNAPAQAFNLMQPIETLERLKSTMPYTELPKRNETVGIAQAQKEAQLLLKTNALSHYLTVNELASMSTEEISRLDVSDDHPFWMSEAFVAKHPAYWQELESFINQTETKKLKLKDSSFSIHNARHVLFLDSIKESATSPKVDTKDAYKLEWKLKWGDEIVSENISTRLAVHVGQKLADMVYAIPPGRDELVLVLGDSKKEGQCVDNMNTVELFVSCLRKSKYKFDVTPYILESGAITAQNAPVVLKNLPLDGKYKQADLIGRFYVAFKEAMLEFKGDNVFVRGGSVAGSFLGAEIDRAARGGMILNMWLGNIDVKDENSRSILVPNFLGSGKTQYAEIIHDYGASLGTLVTGFGSPNHMSTGTDFIEVKKGLFAKERNITFNVPLLFKPKAWDNTSFADGLWMARKIAKVRRANVEQIVASIPWPDYVRAAMVQKILMRRNDIAYAFGVENELDEKTLAPLTIAVSLRTRTEREQAAAKYGLPVVDIEARLSAAKKLGKDGLATHQEVVVLNNQLVECKKSVLTGLLEKNKHPSGLTRKPIRSLDFKPLSDCGFRP